MGRSLTYSTLFINGDSYSLSISRGRSMGASFLTSQGRCIVGKRYAKGSADKKNIKVGDVVTFESKQVKLMVEHRIISMDADGTNIITKGDANSIDDLKGGVLIKPLTLDDIMFKKIIEIPLVFLPCMPLSYGVDYLYGVITKND